MAELAYIGLGSNLDHPRRHVTRALAELSRLPRSRIVGASPSYVSAPLGCAEPQPLSPRSLLARMHAIERRHRRNHHARAHRNAARTLDLDLLLYGRRRLHQPGLTLPHPRMHERAFVLRPLLDLAPAASVPGHGGVRRLLRAVRDQRIKPTRRQPSR
jgi:2-amino-4-hydroxy-6-hydroxymethyldihydropteridine diphosphokinase